MGCIVQADQWIRDLTDKHELRRSTGTKSSGLQLPPLPAIPPAYETPTERAPQVKSTPAPVLFCFFTCWVHDRVGRVQVRLATAHVDSSHRIPEV